MSYSYLALIDTKTSLDIELVLSEKEAGLSAIGMQCCLTHGPIKLFVSRDTPTIKMFEGCILIGHLFSNDGEKISEDTFTHPSDFQRLEKYLLKHYWGDYIVIHPSSDSECGIEILRDPSGGVPCIYKFQDGIGFATSDVSLAIRIGIYRKQIDWKFIEQALIYPYLKTHRTGMDSLLELLPGCTLIIRDNIATVRQDWSPWEFVADKYRHSDPQEAASSIRNAVVMVVKSYSKQDETILLELSGGLDSSIIASCLKHTDSHVFYCNLMTPVPGADERQYANILAEFLDIDLRVDQLEFDNARFDFPQPSYSVTPRIGILQYATNEVKEKIGESLNVTSFFSGGGGDTIFCSLNNAVPAVDAFKERGLIAALRTIHDLALLHQCTVWKAGRLTLRKWLRGPKNPCKPDHSFLATLVECLPDPHPWFTTPPRILPGDRERIADLAGTQIFRDGAPRGYTRQLRLPLLSQPVMEACLKVPTWMCISGGENRSVAREAFSDLLPKGILARKSKGNFTNYAGAFYQRNKQQMLEFLLSGQLQKRNLLDSVAIESYLSRQLPLRDQLYMRLFDLCMIENWTRSQID